MCPEKAAQDQWFKLWKDFFAEIKKGDNEYAARILLENVFEFKRGHYQQEREIIKELFRQNARTLPVQFSSSPVPDQTQITCDYLQR
ncbi:MAG: hypothetical protein R3E95_02195 [Thiolinea sp.]